MSVNVPPISTATANSAGGIDKFLTCDAQFPRDRPVYRIPGNRDSVVSPRRFDGNEAVLDILQYLFGRPMEWMTVTAATACLQQQDVAPPQHGTIGQRREFPFLWRAWIDDCAASAATHTARHAPG